jgi:integral membrane protein
MIYLEAESKAPLFCFLQELLRPVAATDRHLFLPLMKKNSVSLLRKVGLIEGISLLVLLFVAMPLKYIWGEPRVVTVIGWVHGALFVLFMLLVLRVYDQRGWPFKKVVLAFIAAFLPFGTFVFDKQLKEEERK